MGTRPRNGKVWDAPSERKKSTGTRSRATRIQNFFYASLKTKALAVRTANGGSWNSGGLRLIKSCRGDRGLGGGGKAKLDSTGTHRAPTLVNVGVQKPQESPEYPAKHSQERVASWHTPLPPHTWATTLLFSKLTAIHILDTFIQKKVLLHNEK